MERNWIFDTRALLGCRRSTKGTLITTFTNINSCGISLSKVWARVRLGNSVLAIWDDPQKSLAFPNAEFGLQIAEVSICFRPGHRDQ